MKSLLLLTTHNNDAKNTIICNYRLHIQLVTTTYTNKWTNETINRWYATMNKYKEYCDEQLMNKL